MNTPEQTTNTPNQSTSDWAIEYNKKIAAMGVDDLARLQQFIRFIVQAPSLYLVNLTPAGRAHLRRLYKDVPLFVEAYRVMYARELKEWHEGGWGTPKKPNILSRRKSRRPMPTRKPKRVG